MSDSRTEREQAKRGETASGTAKESNVSRRALLVAGGVGLTAGCLRLDSGSSDDGSGGGGGGDDGSSGDDGGGGGGQTNRLQVTASVGIVGQSGTEVVMANMTVKRAPGSGDIDLSEIGVQMVTDSYTANFVHASRDNTPVYFLEPIQTDDQSNTVLSSDGDRYTVKLPLGPLPDDQNPAASDPVDGVTYGANDDLSPLGEGASASVEITTASGGSTSVSMVVPQTLTGSEVVQL